MPVRRRSPCQPALTRPYPSGNMGLGSSVVIRPMVLGLLLVLGSGSALLAESKPTARSLAEGTAAQAGEFLDANALTVLAGAMASGVDGSEAPPMITIASHTAGDGRDQLGGLLEGAFPGTDDEPRLDDAEEASGTIDPSELDVEIDPLGDPALLPGRGEASDGTSDKPDAQIDSNESNGGGLT